MCSVLMLPVLAVIGEQLDETNILSCKIVSLAGVEDRVGGAHL